MTEVVNCKIYKGVMCWLMDDKNWIIEGNTKKNMVITSFEQCKKLINDGVSMWH